MVINGGLMVIQWWFNGDLMMINGDLMVINDDKWWFNGDKWWLMVI